MNDAQLLEALSSKDYLVSSEAENELEAWFVAHPDEALARAHGLCALALASPSTEARQKVGYTVLPLIVASLPPDTTLPEAYDALVSGYGLPDKLRAVLLAIPEARRVRIFEGQLGDSTARNRLASGFLDLAPDFTTAFLRHRFMEDERDVTEWLLFFCSLPRVKQLADAHQEWLKSQPRKPKPPPPPPEPKGTLSFVDGVAVMPEDFDALDAIGKAQYRQAAGAYVGGAPVKDAKDFIKKLKADDLDESDAGMRRWKVLQGRQHRYDFWVVWVDNGSLFEANGKKKLPVHQVQGSFQALEKTPEWLALADDLRRSAPSTLWTVTTPKVKASKPKPPPKKKPGSKPKPRSR